MVHVKFSYGNASHNQNIVNILFLDSDRTDVTLVIEDNMHVSTHLGILSASSKSFRSILYASHLAKLHHLKHYIVADFGINKAFC